MFLSFLLIFILSGCVRPATRTTWSPLDNAVIPVAIVSPSATIRTAAEISDTETPTPPMPTPDWSTLPTLLPKSLKGYELVSWQAGENWNFTLVSGTNRQKSFEDLIEPGSSVGEDGFVKITVAGVDQIKHALDLLPAGEEVFWGGMDLTDQVPSGVIYFTYPPQPIMDDLKDHCKANKVNLIDLQEPS